MQLRPYQQEGIETIYAAFARGVRRQLLVGATGMGKTVLFAHLASQWPGTALVIAHRDRLIQQAAEKIAKVVPWSKIGICKAEQNQIHAQCVIASVQTLARSSRLARMPKFDLVIVDEAHRSAARTYLQILAKVMHDNTLLLGVTATPSRADGIGLDKVYDEIVYQVGLLDLIEQGYLVPLRRKAITIEADFSGLHTKTNTDGVNDYVEKEVIDLMAKSNWHEKVTEGWAKFARDRRTIAFVPRGKDQSGRSTGMAWILAEHMRGQGIRAAAMNGEMPIREQRSLITRFERNEIEVLVNCDLLIEGIDIPSANCALFARITKSLGLFAQSVGRITRLSPETGKTDGLVIEMVGETNRFDLCTLGDLVGIKQMRDGETITEAKAREKKEAEEAADAEQMNLPDNADGKIVGREIGLGGVDGNAPAKPKLLDWRIDPPNRRAILFAGGHRFEIWRAGEGEPYQFAGMDWGSRFEGQTLDYYEARRLCEVEARKMIFGGDDAPWRSKPASEKQIAVLTRFQIRFDPSTITKGQASDLLDAKFNKKAMAAA